MTSDDTRMPAARNDAGAACETQELLQLFDEAQAAGAVRRVGARDWPPPRCAAPRAPRAEDGDPATLSLPAETGVLTARQGRHDRGALTAEGALRIFHARAQRSGNTVHLAAELAQEAGVNTRTVRDIWNLRTWIQTTQPVWSPADCKRHAAERAKKSRQQPSRSTTVPEDEGFDLIPRAVDSTWKLHAAWLTAPAEKLDMGEIDALLAASGAPLPMRPAF